MGNDTFKYTLADFAPQAIIVQHMDLDFDVFDDYTEVYSTLKFKTRDTPLSKISLNADSLEIHTVTCDCEGSEWVYARDEKKLHITLKTPLPPNTECAIRTFSTCRPTNNILDGLYFDETPEGAPPQQITQCQQWGFQRIVPSVDEMNAKCTYTTTITANKKYTNLLTNGNMTQGPDEVTEDRVKVWYDNTLTPMATYLFFLGVGTYATFVREFEYLDGSTFNLELLCPPGTDKDIAKNSLDMLFDSILWIYLYTGKDKYENTELANKLYDLVYEREQGKAEGKDISDVRTQLKTLSADATWGYKYTGTVYREIGMQNSNFGGMENVGNTTISTNRLLPSPDSSDGILEYVQRVKTHEFYHNLNGSEVTGMTPFEIWLNEAVTVHVEKEHHGFTFGDDYSRLQEVQGIISPDGGVLQSDSGALANAIIPEGFNNPDELITSVTYVKAPEFVRMIETILGKVNFVKGLAAYHEKFHHSNATTNDWLAAMQNYTSVNLAKFAKSWLYKTSFPVVHATRLYDSETKTYTIQLTQKDREDGTLWQFPFIAALCDAKGEVLAEKQVFVDTKEFTITFENVISPAFVSLNRGYCYFGKFFDDNQTEEELLLQVRNDQDVIAKYFAFYQLWDTEKTRLLENKNETPRTDLIDLIVELLQDGELMERTGVNFLARFESVEDPRFTHDYEAVYQVRKKISVAVSLRHKDVLKKLYLQASKSKPALNYMQTLNDEIKSRQIKNLCLAFLAKLDTPEVHELIRKQYADATVAGERNIAASLYIESTASDREEFLKEFIEFGKSNLRRWEILLALFARSDSPDVLELIARVEALPEFRIEQANDSRGLYLNFAANQRLSLLTEWGREYMQQLLPRLAVVSEFTTVHVLKQFAHIDKLVNAADRAACYTVLVETEKSLAPQKDKFPMAYNNLKRLLENSIKSKADWEAAL